MLRAENEGEESVTYQFRSSCQASTSSVTGAGDHSRLEITCAQILTELELSPGEQKDFPFRWNQADHRGTPVFGRGISDRGLSCRRQRPAGSGGDSGGVGLLPDYRIRRLQVRISGPPNIGLR